MDTLRGLYSDRVPGKDSTSSHLQDNYSSHIGSMTLGKISLREGWFPIKVTGSTGFILEGGANSI